MDTTNEQLIRSLERRAELVRTAPPARFSTELAAFLGFLASHTDLRAVITASLEHEVQRVGERHAERAILAQEYAAKSALIAQGLAEKLQHRLNDTRLPRWLGPLLRSYSEKHALAALERGGTPWPLVQEALEDADAYTDEIACLISEVNSVEAQWSALRLVEERQTMHEVTHALAHLWGHVQHSISVPLLPEWRPTLGSVAQDTWEQSNMVLLQHELMATNGSGDVALRTSLYHDLRRLTVAITEALETRPLALPTIERFKGWCEMYERAELLRKVRPGKKATEATRRRKRSVMIAEVMRYLYHQRFAPFTLAMLEDEQLRQMGFPQRASRPVLVEIHVVSDRDTLLQSYVGLVQALRSSESLQHLALREAFLMAFLVEPIARFVEPAPLRIGNTLLHSVAVDLTKSSDTGRQPLSVDTIANRVAEEDQLFNFLNTASEDDLDAVPGIGPTKVQQIVAGRPYGSANDLKRSKLPTSGVLYQALRSRALRGMQTLMKEADTQSVKT
ncbi:MAG: hypothetical protein GFH27_549297n88 [Chloroflexi bacterium AL-W]|nr:hypothetical protein [Chloroflexi bacterium AL-N1]NOK68612.1 hypothetical protein [Chloroflexi bacterium AL-N10]NOK76098.1 hypothetical protein [Chloroflexi bacterium AL-N5]NOK82571.1 hypothetical protein [Chloroflexi bacterium AL-W]NOK93369.1 hypothetical protein [Chloroflexi bacterium AL-N15]